MFFDVIIIGAGAAGLMKPSEFPPGKEVATSNGIQEQLTVRGEDADQESSPQAGSPSPDPCSKAAQATRFRAGGSSSLAPTCPGIEWPIGVSEQRVKDTESAIEPARRL